MFIARIGEPATSSSESQKQYRQFCGDYMTAWTASSKPTDESILETFDAALEGKEITDPQVHALWIFFRAALLKNAPLNWFCKDGLKVIGILREKHRNEQAEALGAQTVSDQRILDSLSARKYRPRRYDRHGREILFTHEPPLHQ